MREQGTGINSDHSLGEVGRDSKHSSGGVSLKSHSHPEGNQSWIDYSLKLQKEVKSLKSQNQDLQAIVTDQTKEIAKMTKQLDHFRAQKHKSIISSQIQQSTYLKQQLKQTNKALAETRTENEWLKTKVSTKTQERIPQTNLKMEEEVRNLRYSYQIFQEKMGNLMENISQKTRECDSLKEDNFKLKLLIEKGNRESQNVNENLVKEINGLEQNFKMYLEVNYFEDNN